MALGMPWRIIISADGWKLSLSAEDQCELDDLNTDPYEEGNLFDARVHRGRVQGFFLAPQELAGVDGRHGPLPDVGT